ncbi:putative non-specific serine/threonine protein kinase [Helianthus annuus]|uniref:Uncharacterized protein n=1 Tax=Helianthus annuus TaxID=4232 RepID=A0A251TWJ6_HELAN|nr:putative non-specific serine/threonine protein kinase [Helianthus annuus]
MKPMIITSSCSYCIQRILCVQFSILDYLHLSKYCRHLLFHIFVANPSKVPFLSKYRWHDTSIYKNS